MKTLRKKIIEILENSPHTAEDIAQLLGIREKEVWEHLHHIDKSLKPMGKQLDITPYYCIDRKSVV